MSTLSKNKKIILQIEKVHDDPASIIVDSVVVNNNKVNINDIRNVINSHLRKSGMMKFVKKLSFREAKDFVDHPNSRKKDVDKKDKTIITIVSSAKIFKGGIKKYITEYLYQIKNEQKFKLKHRRCDFGSSDEALSTLVEILKYKDELEDEIKDIDDL